MSFENNDKKNDSVYSKRIRAGKRRTYFFDLRTTKGNDFFLTITESRKRFNDDGYDRHKIFVYKEDFNKFVKGLVEAIDYVKTDLMPDFDFDAFNHEYPEGEYDEAAIVPPGVTAENNPELSSTAPVVAMPIEVNVELPKPAESNSTSEEVDKW